MAGFCAKCGAPRESSTGFCPACGGPITSQPAPPVPPAAVKKPGGTLKVVLIVAAAAIAVFVLGVGTLGFLGWRALHSGGNNLTMGQKANVSEADLGVSIYPGAVRVESGSMRIKIAGTEAEGARYTTSDPASAVLSYYQQKLGPNATTTERNGMTLLTLSSTIGNTKDSVVVSVTPGAQAAGSTQITIRHTKVATQ